MYGLMHRGLRQMVTDQLGADQWAALERALDIGPAEQISLSSYDDALTMRIIAGAAEKLGYGMDECLRVFGRYWIDFLETGSYRSIMDFTGGDLASFIGNLDRMHQTVQTAMPQARVPSFSIIESAPGALRVQYRSERQGLEPLVVGLLEGLLDRFDLVGQVGQVASSSNAAEFLITYGANRG